MSTPAEAIPVPDIVFKGTDGNECEAFIVAIRDFAFATGREKDRHWMLYFAATRLRGKALRWHARLDSSIKEDWDLFVQALFDQYPLVEEPGSDEVATPVWSVTAFSPGPSTVALPPNPEADRNLIAQKVPAPPTRQCDTSRTGPQVGLLRIVNTDVEETSIPQYLGWYAGDPDCTHPAMTTFNRYEALVVNFLPSTEPHQIRCLNSNSLKPIALEWSHPVPEPQYFPLHTYSDFHEVTTPAANTWGYVKEAWNVLVDGTLQATLSSFSRKSADEAYEETKFETTEVHVVGGEISFVKPRTLVEQDKPQGSPIHGFVRLRIVFEPF